VIINRPRIFRAPIPIQRPTLSTTFRVVLFLLVSWRHAVLRQRPIPSHPFMSITVET
jgi:hypothetical protein